MSDQDPNGNVDEVLSSIRRLVAVKSGDRRVGTDVANDPRLSFPAPKAAGGDMPRGDDPAEDVPRAGASGALMLTADQKVAAQPGPRPDPSAASDPDVHSVPPQVTPGGTADVPRRSSRRVTVLRDVAKYLVEDSEPGDAFEERRARLEETIAALEQAVADQDAGWEPDGSEQQSRPVINWADAGDAFGAIGTDAAVPDAPHKETDRQRSAGIDALRAVPGGEDLLRKMIADAVRAELQGEMGERITRNVRKLVRREIYRVLNSGDLG